MKTKKRLIDANALKYERVLQKTTLNTIDAVPYYEIEDAPTVDAVEVVHGRWMEAPHPMQKQCSVCKAFIVNLSTKKEHEYSYCPNCGAKMDG